MINIISGIPVLLAILGARLEILSIFYIMLALLILGSWIAFKINLNKYIWLYSFGLSLLLASSLIGESVIGTDIHGELYYAWLTYSNGFWNINVPWEYNTSISTVVLFPFLSWILNIPLEWIFKTLPFITLAFLGPLSYYLYKSIIDIKVAYTSSLFLLIMPTFFTELVGIAKQSIAEPFIFIFFIILLLWNSKWKYLLLFLTFTIVLITHYSSTLILLGYFGVYIVLSLIKDWKSQHNKKLVGVLIIMMLASITYWGTIAQGKVLNNVLAIFRLQTQTTVTAIQQTLPQTIEPTTNTTIASLNITKTLDNIEQPREVQDPEKAPFEYLNSQEQLVRIALGLDFLEKDLLSKVFRILQFLTQLLFLVGIWIWLRDKHKRNSKYSYLIVGGVCLIGAVIFLPGFSAFMNASRFYHCTLLICSPLIVLGGIWILRKLWIVGVIFSIYFLFTSGSIFEISKVPNTGDITIPWSNFLSYQRLETTVKATKCDLIVRDEIVKRQISMVSGDHWGQILLIERLGDKAKVFPWNFKEVSKESYLYFREENIRSNSITRWRGIGLRDRLFMNPEVLENREIIYRCGNSIVFGPQIENTN